MAQPNLRFSLNPQVEALLAQHAFYQVHLRLLLSTPKVQQAMEEYESARRQAAGDNADMLTMLSGINRAQNALVQTCKQALTPYPNLQAKLNHSHLQLVLVDALCAMGR